MYIHETEIDITNKCDIGWWRYIESVQHNNPQNVGEFGVYDKHALEKDFF